MACRKTNLEFTRIKLDCRYLSKVFKRLKENGILSEPIKIKVSKRRVDSLELDEKLLKTNNLIDKLIYYRKLKGISQSSISRKLGIQDDTYRHWENKVSKIQTATMLDRIIEILDIKDKIDIPEIYIFMKKYPLKYFLKHIKENGYTNREFSELTGVDRGTINSWIRGTTKNISIENYSKLKEYTSKVLI